MATATKSIQFENPVQRLAKDHPTTTTAFDGVAVILAVWFMAGLFLDGWAHSHNQVDSFFTPWHGVLYSGFLANAAFITWTWIKNIRKGGYTFWGAIPAGYELSLVGAAIFAVGGGLDFLWHTILGIEVNFEALVSPSHLVLALGLFLIISGPFRAAWRRASTSSSTLVSLLPMLLSLTFTLSVLTFFTFPLHPFVNAWAGTSQGTDNIVVEGAFAAILLQSAFLMGCLLVAMRRWQLPFGSIALIMTINTAALSVITLKVRFIPAALLTGLLADMLILTLKPSVKNLWAFRTFAFVIPTVLYLLYFATLTITSQVWWSVPLWSGAAVLAGVIGLLVSYVTLPSPALAIPKD